MVGVACYCLPHSAGLCTAFCGVAYRILRICVSHSAASILTSQDEVALEESWIVLVPKFHRYHQNHGRAMFDNCCAHPCRLSWALVFGPFHPRGDAPLPPILRIHISG